jgi:hypothetical protein
MGMISEAHDEIVADKLLTILKYGEVNSRSMKIFLADTVYRMYLEYKSGEDQASSYKQFLDEDMNWRIDGNGVLYKTYKSGSGEFNELEGYIFQKDGNLYCQVNSFGKELFKELSTSKEEAKKKCDKYVLDNLK